MSTTDLKNFIKKTIKANVNLFYREQKVAMLHPGRCGSTVLGAMLNWHSKIRWNGEIFERYWGKKHGKDPRNFVKHILKEGENTKISKCYGFETKYLPQQHLSDNCIGLSIDKYLELLKELNYSKFIILRRKNYLRRAISVIVGRKTKKWHSKDISSKPTPVNIDIKSSNTGGGYIPLIDTFIIMDKNYEYVKNFVSDRNLLELNYEDNIKDSPENAYKKVLEFLGYGYESVSIPFKKTNPFEIQEMIINYSEVKSVLGGTKYEWMLYD